MCLFRSRLDALVYLDGYDRCHRLDIVAQRPRAAPLVASYFGFLASLGAGSTVNAIVADALSLPPAPAAAPRLYAERRLLRLPAGRSFFVSDHATMHAELLGAPPFSWPAAPDARFEAALAPLPANAAADAAAAPFTFCCFSQLFKLSAETVAAWLAVLRRAPRARLVLMDHPPTARANLEAHLAAVAPALAARVRFLPLLPRAEHLLAKRAACALGLDTFFYNGHTSVADLLWAGVPVLTYASANSSMAGRAAASLIAAAGAPRDFFAAAGADEYVETAVRVYEAYIAALPSTVLASVSASESASAGVGADGEHTAEGTAAAVATAVANDPLLWRPTKDAPLFDREGFARAFEDVIAAAAAAAVEASAAGA